MELASLAAREPWSDHPACVHPVLAAVARAVNDGVSDACRPRLGALVPQMIGTAARGTADDQRVYLDRSARITMRCATVALGQTTLLGSEMESARRTALAVLARLHRMADSASKTDRADHADRSHRRPGRRPGDECESGAVGCDRNSHPSRRCRRAASTSRPLCPDCWGSGADAERRGRAPGRGAA